ncbi:MAG: alpha/beta hydrolase, partial [Chloroflexota bacterium]
RIVTHFGQGEPVRIIGHSWGAMLTAAYVGQHPESVSHAVLAEPGALDNAGLDQFLQRQSGSQGFGYYRKLVPTIFETLQMELPDDQAQQDYIYGKMTKYFVDSEASGYRCVDEGITAVQPNVPVPDSRYGSVAYQTLFGETADLSPISQNAENFKGDLLFLAGECSKFIGTEFQQQQMVIFPQAQLETISDAGHEMFSENPDGSIDVARAFFDDGVASSK